MITRGHFIGEIIDELSTIAEQTKIRNNVGMNDLSTFAEGFFCDFLNILHDYKLKSLNQKRSNEPGLDLGDKIKKIGIQVTSSATSDKVNETLKKITKQQKLDYTRIVVLAIGKKQGSYTVDPALASGCDFDEREDIWDVNTLARQVVALELVQLQKLHSFVRKSVVQLKVDLEVPDKDGNYPTSGYTLWEERKKPTMGTGKPFIQYCSGGRDRFSKEEKREIRAAIVDLSDRLAKTPRITREFLAMLCERRDGPTKRSPDSSHILVERVLRECSSRKKEMDAEMSLLEHVKIASLEKEDIDEVGAPEIVMTFSDNEELSLSFCGFVEEKGLSFRRVIGEIDFSEF